MSCLNCDSLQGENGELYDRLAAVKEERDGLRGKLEDTKSELDWLIDELSSLHSKALRLRDAIKEVL